MVCLLAAAWVQLSTSAGNGWQHNALWHHWLMPISCHFRDCNVLLVTSLTHVSGTITSVETFTFIVIRSLKRHTQTPATSVVNLTWSHFVCNIWWSYHWQHAVEEIRGNAPEFQSGGQDSCRGVILGETKMLPLNSRGRISYSHSIVTIGLWCTV